MDPVLGKELDVCSNSDLLPKNTLFCYKRSGNLAKKSEQFSRETPDQCLLLLQISAMHLEYAEYFFMDLVLILA